MAAELAFWAATTRACCAGLVGGGRAAAAVAGAAAVSPEAEPVPTVAKAAATDGVGFIGGSAAAATEAVARGFAAAAGLLLHESTITG